QQLVAEGTRLERVACVDALIGDWDPVRLERVIANLLDNAIKYSPNGGTIVVTIRRDESAGRPGATLAVADQGIGIPAEDVPHVFERFHRGQNVVGRFAGTGFGLAIARQIVEQHGGSITVASVEGAGTTFSIWLPLMPPDECSHPK